VRLIAVRDIATLSESERELLDQQLNDVKRPLRGVELAVYELEEDGDSPRRCVAARASQVEVGALVAARTWATVRQKTAFRDEADRPAFTSLNFADELIPVADRRSPGE
jgi:hypothetical protein